MRTIAAILKKKRMFLGLIGLFLLALIFAVQKRNLDAEPKIKLYLHEENRAVELPLEEYVAGALAAEMPASFELEALKAQAVAIRTYTLRRLLAGVKYALDADMSDDVNSCQAYVSFQQFRTRNPGQWQEYWEKINKAVSDTRGEIILYDNQPIDALYSSTCGGCTASASEAWGRDIPYLQSVKCDYCKDSKHYEEVLVFSNSDLTRALGFEGVGSQVYITSFSQSGRVKEIKVNQHVMSGESFRKLLNLPSSRIKVSGDSRGLTINSRGYGHGIGMCQYGANGMACQGRKYHQILRSYYQGVDFCKLDY